jgi:DNA-binding transcriptional LysR family regulator
VIYRWELERNGKNIVVDLPSGLVVDDIALMVALAREGVGLAYVPDQPILLEDIAKRRLERVLESYVTKGPGFYLYFPARTQSQPKLRALIDSLAQVGLTPQPRTRA